MKNASDYRRHAEECRELVSQASQALHRDRLIEMAQTWEALAAERDARTRMYAELRLQGRQESPFKPVHRSPR